MNDDQFFERMREDARQLRYDAGDVAYGRLRARVRSRIERPGIADLLAAWFRPLAASLAGLALATVLGLSLYERNQPATLTSDPVEVSMGGDVFSVVD